MSSPRPISRKNKVAAAIFVLAFAMFLAKSIPFDSAQGDVGALRFEYPRFFNAESCDASVDELVVYLDGSGTRVRLTEPPVLTPIQKQKTTLAKDETQTSETFDVSQPTKREPAVFGDAPSHLDKFDAQLAVGSNETNAEPNAIVANEINDESGATVANETGDEFDTIAANETNGGPQGAAFDFGDWEPLDEREKRRADWGVELQIESFEPPQFADADAPAWTDEVDVEVDDFKNVAFDPVFQFPELVSPSLIKQINGPTLNPGTRLVSETNAQNAQPASYEEPVSNAPGQGTRRPIYVANPRVGNFTAPGTFDAFGNIKK